MSLGEAHPLQSTHWASVVTSQREGISGDKSKGNLNVSQRGRGKGKQGERDREHSSHECLDSKDSEDSVLLT